MNDCSIENFKSVSFKKIVSGRTLSASSGVLGYSCVRNYSDELEVERGKEFECQSTEYRLEITVSTVNQKCF